VTGITSLEAMLRNNARVYLKNVPFIFQNTTFRRLDSVSVFRWNLLSWAQLIGLVPISWKQKGKRGRGRKRKRSKERDNEEDGRKRDNKEMIQRKKGTVINWKRKLPADCLGRGNGNIVI
jgi:hypothetical protein